MGQRYVSHRGGKLINWYDTTWHQAWAGTERAVTLVIDGNTFTTTTPRFKGSLTGLQVERLRPPKGLSSCGPLKRSPSQLLWARA